MNAWIPAFLLMAAASGGLLALDLRGYFNVTSDPIAHLEFQEGTVKRLARKKLSWDRASAGTLFAIGDTISTGEQSRARLVFHSGGEMEIGTGSMVRLKGTAQELKLSFVSGTAKLRVSPTASAKIQVTHASEEKVASRAGKSKAPLARARVIEEKLVAKAEKPKTASSPAVAANTAQAAPEAAQPELDDFAPPKLMTAVIREELIKEPEKALKTGDTIAIAPKLPSAPSIVLPAKDSVVVADLSSPSAPVVEWARADGAASYEVSLRPAEGATSSKVIRTENTTLAAKDLGRGKYAFVVRAVSPEGKRGPASVERWVHVQGLPKVNRQPRILPVQIE